jgi:hypothetical protein
MRLSALTSLGLTICLFTPFFGGTTWALPLPQELPAAQLIHLGSWQKQFKITDGKDQGKLVPLTLQRDTVNRDIWRLIFGDYAGLRLITDSSGGLVMEQLDLFKSRSFVVYERGLPILPQNIASPGSIRRYAEFKMYDRQTGKLKRSGRASHLIRQVSHSQFRTPAGLIDGYHIEIEHRMDMPYAQLDMLLGLGCRLDEGPVYGYGQYTIKKLGIFSETKTAAAGLAGR